MTPIREYREISLTQGKVALVDECDFERIGQHKWCARLSKNGKWYAIRTINYGTCRADYKTKTVLMHREVMEMREGDRRQIDHRRTELTLDNRRSNLRVATASQNAANTGLRSTNTSGYKGVTFFKPQQKWRVQLKKDGVLVLCRYFKHKLDAAQVYILFAYLHFGEFARHE